MDSVYVLLIFALCGLGWLFWRQILRPIFRWAWNLLRLPAEERKQELKLTVYAAMAFCWLCILMSPRIEPVFSWLILLPVIIYASYKKAGTVKQKIMFGVASAILLAFLCYLKSFL